MSHPQHPRSHRGTLTSIATDTPHREPFSLRNNPPRTTTNPSPRKRKSKHDTENLPPDNAPSNHPFKAYNSNTTSSADAPSCSPFSKSVPKPKNRGSTPLTGSPLPPRPPPPSSRPSPAAVSEVLTGGETGSGQEAMGTAKRKLNWESQVEGTAIDLSSAPLHEIDTDTGVKVIVRLRPLNHKEEQDEATHIVERTSNNSLCLADQAFTFDAVVGHEASQQSVFQTVGLPLVENCLAGFNSSIFAYGQTGSGKTYTMWGAVHDPIAGQSLSEDRGLTPRVFERLFKRMEEEENKNADKQLRYQCQCSFLEIYNEQITDLLDPMQKNLQIREDTKTGVYVENLTGEYVSNIDDVTRLLLRGLANRRIGATSMNSESSRSHSVFTCVIESRCKSMADGMNSVRTSRMNLVDLAGSERQKLTGATGERLKEAGNINRSLSQLGNLINILAEVSQTGRQRHIPYRDSRLTFLLQESLGGNAKLAMICAISPASSCRSETLSTLRFAQRAKAITNKAVVNEETENDVNFLREQVRQLKDELMRIKSNQPQSGGAGGYSTSWDARRSYNLLKMSLSHPLILPHEESDVNEEMEIDDNMLESMDSGNLSISEDESMKFDSSLSSRGEKEIFQTKVADVKKEMGTNGSLVAWELASSQIEAEQGLVNLTSSYESKKDMIVLDHLKERSDEREMTGEEEESMKFDSSLSSSGGKEIFQTKLADVKKEMGTNGLLVAWELASSQIEAEQGLVDLTSTYESKKDMIVFDHLKERSDERETTVEEEDDHFMKIGSPCINGYISETEDWEMQKVPVEGLESELGCSEVSEGGEREKTSSNRLGEGLKLDLVLNETYQIDIDSCCAQRQEDLQNEFEFCDDSGSFKIEGDLVCNGAHVSETNVVEEESSQYWLSNHHGDKRLLHDLSHDSGPNIDKLSRSLLFSEADSASHAFMNPDIPSSETVTRTPKSKSSLQSPSPHLASLVLESPTLTVSPQIREDCKRGFDDMDFPALAQDATFQTWPSELGKACEEVGVKTPVRSSFQSSNNLSTNQLALSLLHGMQVLENPRSISGTHKSLMRISFQNTEFIKKPLGIDKGVQTSPTKTIEAGSSPVPELGMGTLEMTDINMPNSPLNDQAIDKLQCQLVAFEEPKTPVPIPSHTESQDHISQTVEGLKAVLAGAIRRERTMEEALRRKNAEIEQLDRLVCQYKHERECNTLMQQSREDKILRLDGLMDGVIDTDAFLNEELLALANEHKLLQDKFDHHPEITHAKLEQQRLCDQLEQYQHFFDLGEREVLLEEICQLRNLLQSHVDRITPKSYVDRKTPTSAKQRRLCLTPKAIEFPTEIITEAKSSLVLCTVPENACYHSPEKVPLVESESLSSEKWEEERRQWAKRENEWMLALDELRFEAETYKALSEERKQKVECEQRCAEEMREALQMAMKGHARLLDQYAEFQEKHIALLAKHRKIREGVADVKRKAGKAGIKETRWLEAQTAEIVALKLQQEREREAAKVQIEELRAQLQDTADAVQAAGELLVRLKEAEEAVSIAQDSAVLAEREAAAMHCQIEKLKREHSAEIGTVQQQLLDSQFQRSAVCPMCLSAEHVQFQFPEVDARKTEAALVAEHEHLATVTEEEALFSEHDDPDAFHQFRAEFEPFPQDFEDQNSYTSSSL